MFTQFFKLLKMINHLFKKDGSVDMRNSEFLVRAPKGSLANLKNMEILHNKVAYGIYKGYNAVLLDLSKVTYWTEPFPLDTKLVILTDETT